MTVTHVLPDHEAMSHRAAEWLAEHIGRQPSSLLCLAAGDTPMRSYELLRKQGESEPRLLASARILKLDEWGGLAMTDLATCEQSLQRTLIEPLGAQDRYCAFQSDAIDPALECQRVDHWLQQNGPIDICVLGLGINGHVGFNEPGRNLQAHSHVATLSAASLRHAMLLRTDRHPTCGLTLGMADILHARHILLLVSGAKKRRPLEHVLRGPVTTDFPASLLMLHPHVTILCDAEAYPLGI